MEAIGDGRPGPPESSEQERYVFILRNTALVAVIACPVLALIPPRKLDFFTFGLAGTTIFSTNYLIRDQTGRSVWQHIRPNRPQSIIQQPSSSSNDILSGTVQDSATLKGKNGKKNLLDEVQTRRQAWKQQRQQEIKDDVEEGKGFGDMIIDQVWEVWNWGKSRDDDDQE